MSLTSILTAAGSALTTAQYRMAVSQTNVANVDDETYSRKTVSTTATSTTSAVSSGVVTRAADAYLSKAVISTASAASRDSTIDSYLQTYDASLGSVDGGDDISSLLDAFQTALSSLASSSTSASAKAQVVSAASAVASSLNSLSSDIQDLRTQANSEIATTVDSINTSLSTLQSLNDQIVTTAAQGGDTTSLEDQRTAELATLSSMIGISSYLTSDNKVAIYTTSGDQLLGASAAKLSYAASSSLSADTVYPDTISGVMLNGKDITTATASGSLGALITLRDDTLVGEQDAIDALAGALIAQVNAVAADTFTGTDAGDIAVSATLLADPSTFTSDATTASNLLTVLSSDVPFAAAGSMSAGTSSLLDYASSFVSTAATMISDATAQSESSTATHDAATTRLANLTAVNLDEELALLEVYQQGYQANAQLISMVQDLFDTLISMVN
jgi:flagellar hook-associated protein 1 FlgK